MDSNKPALSQVGGTKISRRSVARGAAWSIPVVAIAAPVPAFAGASQGVLQLSGLGCKLPGNSNTTFKGYAFRLTASNPRSDVAFCIRIDSVTLNGTDLGDAAVVNFDSANGCGTAENPFCVPASTELSNLALVTSEAGSSANGQLIVTYSVRETATCGSCDSSGTFVEATPVSTPANAAPPISGSDGTGGSCPDTTFSDAQKNCLATL